MVIGDGYTWFSVMSVDPQRVGKKDVNAFFGNLRNGRPYEGFWGCLTDNNHVWMGSRNGVDYEQTKGSLWDATRNPRVASRRPLREGRYYLVMGRMGAGPGVVDLELFVNTTASVDRKPVPVNPRADPSKMAVGQERDATNHPGKGSFDGSIARFLIFDRPLSDPELQRVAEHLVERYQVKVTDD